MIENFNNNNRKDDIRLLMLIIVGFIWLCTPPGNKFMQLCLWGNNTQFVIAKLTNNYYATEYQFHRKNAIYLAKMNYRKNESIREMNKAISTAPSYLSSNEIENLYRERAELYLYWKEYKKALDDYLRVSNLSIVDKLKVGLLYAEAGHYRYGLSYCNEILDVDPNAYAGFACLADIYGRAGRYNTSVRLFDLLIDRVPNKGRYYADRAMYKNKAGDIDGSNKDIEKAKELTPMINLEESIINDTLNPKILNLNI